MTRLYALMILELPDQLPTEKRSAFNDLLWQAGWDVQGLPFVWTRTFYPDLADARSNFGSRIADEVVAQRAGIATTIAEVHQLTEALLRAAASSLDIWKWSLVLQVGPEEHVGFLS